MAPNKLINEIDDEFPDTERTIFNIVKEEQKSITVDKEESQQNDQNTAPIFHSISKKKKKVVFSTVEITESEDIEKKLGVKEIQQ